MAGGSSMYAAGAGATMSTIFSIIKGAKQKKLAKEQAREAQKLRNKALLVQKPELQKEFRDVEKMKALQTMMGLPAKNIYQDEIGSQTATALRAGKEGATAGGDYLTYASSLYADQQQQERDLKAQDATYRSGALDDYSQTLWQIGNEELKNKAIQKEERDRLLAQANALENASTANKWGGDDTALSGSADAAMMFGGAASANSAGSFKQPTEQNTQSAGASGAGKTSDIGGSAAGKVGGSGKTGGNTTGQYGGAVGDVAGSGKTSGGDYGFNPSEQAYYEELIRGGATDDEAFREVTRKFRG